MKTKFFLLLLFLSQITYGQNEKLIKVPGTKCSMVPPAGFIASTSFSGFQNAESGASIMINEMPMPYQTLVDGFTAEALKSRNMTLISKKEIDFNKSKATLLNVTQPANGITYLKQMLIFGDEKVTVLANGIYPETAKNMEVPIKNALLSTVYDLSQTENPLDAVPFTLDVKDTDFKLVRYLSGSLLYSIDGKIPTVKPTLIVAGSISKISAINQKNYAAERIKKLPRGEFTIIKEINPITINNLKGYEIIATGKSLQENPELVYQVMLFNEEGDYYILIGQAKENFESNLGSFKNITKTFKVK